MSKIDQLSESIARMEGKIDGFLKSQELQGRMLNHHDKILRGDSEGSTEGICEQVRNINKRHALVATIIPAGMMAVVEFLRRKIGGG